jgi:hypothetical protein
MRISKHIITQMQKALVTYGIHVPVTGEFDAKLQQAYVDWAGRNETQGCILYPITDAQVSAKLLALAPSADDSDTTVVDSVIFDTDLQTQVDLDAQAAAEEEAAAQEADARIKAANQTLADEEALTKDADDPTQDDNAETQSTDDTKPVSKKRVK